VFGHGMSTTPGWHWRRGRAWAERSWNPRAGARDSPCYGADDWSHRGPHDRILDGCIDLAL